MSVSDRYVRLTAEELAIEHRQARDEGRDLSAVRETFDALRDAADAGEDVAAPAGDLLDRVQELPRRDDYPYEEPASLDAIRDASPTGPQIDGIACDDAELYERILGAWQGRCAGCLLGKPIETVPAAAVWDLLEELDAFPLSGYLPADIPSDVATEHGLDDIPAHNRTYAGAVDRMPRDDDIDYTIIGLAALGETGRAITAPDVATQWLSTLPAFNTYTAERVAYRNLLTGHDPPASATRRNPFREWIGAQIRADPYGYAAVGDPKLAAELAWRDARVSHVNNGIYGSMWVAAMLAAAPAVDTPVELVTVGLAQIPSNCRLAEAIHTVREWSETGLDWRDAVDRLHDRWDDRTQHDWLHTISNAQIVAMGLLWSDDAFGRAITRAVHAGFDTDCNGATVGSIMGMYCGADAIDERWTAPLADEVETTLATRPRARISALAEETVDVHRAIRGDAADG